MSPQTSIRKLTIADIADEREYDRGREEFRAHSRSSSPAATGCVRSPRKSTLVDSPVTRRPLRCTTSGSSSPPSRSSRWPPARYASTSIIPTTSKRSNCPSRHTPNSSPTCATDGRPVRPVGNCPWRSEPDGSRFVLFEGQSMGSRTERVVTGTEMVGSGSMSGAGRVRLLSRRRRGS